jgi:thymidylate synthase
MYQVNNTADIKEAFKKQLEAENYVTDKTGLKTIEILGASFIADKPAIFGTPNEEYINAEIEWYNSKSTNINKLAEIYGKSPAAWEYSANDYGEINSNYGHLIFSKKFHKQYQQVLNELSEVNPDSRRASMIYQRPSIWREYKEDGKNDFICTNAVTYYIRNEQLHCVVQMRSNDVIYGYRNDYAWQKYVLEKLEKDLYFSGHPLKIGGTIHWQVQNLHVYERHFHLVK